MTSKMPDAKEYNVGQVRDDPSFLVREHGVKTHMVSSYILPGQTERRSSYLRKRVKTHRSAGILWYTLVSFHERITTQLHIYTSLRECPTVLVATLRIFPLGSSRVRSMLGYSLAENFSGSF